MPEASNRKPRCRLIACDVFAPELRSLGVDEAITVFLPMGLHDQPSQLRQALQAEIDGADKQARIDAESDVKPGAILLAYARCGDGLVGLRARRLPLIIPRADDCMALFLGGGEEARAFRRRHPDWYFATAGWANGGLLPGPGREARIRERYREKYPDDDELVEDLVDADRDTYGHYTTLACIQTTENDPTGLSAACAGCAAAMGWRQQSLEGTVTPLQKLLEGPWPEEAFLTVPPGYRIVAANDARVLAAEPFGDEKSTGPHNTP